MLIGGIALGLLLFVTVGCCWGLPVFGKKFSFVIEQKAICRFSAYIESLRFCLQIFIVIGINRPVINQEVIENRKKQLKVAELSALNDRHSAPL